MKLICENNNSSHINANGVRDDAADTIGQLDTLLPLCTLGENEGIKAGASKNPIQSNHVATKFYKFFPPFETET